MAHKKAQWTTNNNRDSQSQRLWVKVFGGQPVKAGWIIIRQRWNKYWAWENTQTGKDFTIFSTIEWKVSFEQKRRTRFDWSVYKDIYVNVQ